MNPSSLVPWEAAPAPGPPTRRGPRRIIRTVCALAWLATSPWSVLGAEPPGRPEPAGSGESIAVESLNEGLPRRAHPPDLETPQSSLENFIGSCRRDNYDRAAWSLNLNDFPAERQAEAGRRLARQLMAVMDQQVWFHWDEVPDRPDGQQEEGKEGKGVSSGRGKQPPSLLLYSLFIGDHDYEIRLERLRAGRQRPVWVFSRQTVRHIPVLFERFGPRQFERRIPGILKRISFVKIALWQWIGFGLLLVASLALAWVVRKGLGFALRHTQALWPKTILGALQGPGALTLGLWLFFALASRYLSLAGPILDVLWPLYVTILAGALIWFLQRLVGCLSMLIGRSYESRNNDEANEILTRIAVARHLLVVLVAGGGTLFILTRFEWFRQIGMTLLASAGVAGLILGIAAQRVLGNLFAGLVLAITQPVKTGDAILFEGEFGWIEEIALTYIVIRVWDLRRIIVPITHLMDRPFQNWSRQTQQLIQPVYVHADSRIDVEAVRAEFGKILEESPEWDRVVPPILQVTGSRESTLELRVLCSAGDPTSNWNLQCRVRERLIGFIRDLEGGRYLPRTRVTLADTETAACGPLDDDTRRPDRSAVHRNGRPAPEKNVRHPTATDEVNP